MNITPTDPNASLDHSAMSVGCFQEVARTLTDSSQDHFHITGTGSHLAAAALATQTKISIPQVFVVNSDEEIAPFIEAVQFFQPHRPVYQLQSFDVSPYSNLYPNPRLIARRIEWLHQAQQAVDDSIFVASIQGLLQKTLPFSVLKQQTLYLEQDEEIPEDLAEQLTQMGFRSVPVVEDVGTFAFRGGILDIFSPAEKHPVRMELFGDTIDSMRLFDSESQRSMQPTSRLAIIPPREVLYFDDEIQELIRRFRESVDDRDVDPGDVRETSQSMIHMRHFQGIDYLLPLFYDQLEFPLEHFSSPVALWLVEPLELARKLDDHLSTLKKESEESLDQVIHLPYQSYCGNFEELQAPPDSTTISIESINIQDQPEGSRNVEFPTSSLEEFQNQCHNLLNNTDQLTDYIKRKFAEWRDKEYSIFISTRTHTQFERLQLLLKQCGFEASLVGENQSDWQSWIKDQDKSPQLIHIVPRPINESLRWVNDRVLFLKEEDFFGKKSRRRAHRTSGTLKDRAHALSFGDLKPGDAVIHKLHGLGIYEGLKVMDISGVESEFIQLEYKDGDKLYLPIFRVNQIQKYAGGGAKNSDKLGGSQWNRVKKKVKKQVRDIASELLKLYAERAKVKRPPFSPPGRDFIAFENSFPFEETEDQLKTINDVLSDMNSPQPMDRLICGDVGFGKTEIAMRAAFKAVEDGKQVAIICPTTILCFQHSENFTKRFKDWPVKIKALNRFFSQKEIKATLEELKNGQVDIVIGTHRLLSKDVGFKKLGLLIVDEEQKFGVKHKERIRQMKVSVDTLAMSATPIPRTLNMSLVGLRDLSLITTPPIDRLPTRTFVCKFDKETFRKAIESELKRGGQVFFLHNRVHSIYAVTSELREIVPDARIAVAHGQMEEKELEKTMLAFFHQEIDVLVCTTIIESGMDIPKANTMFIDNAHALGLSQLYQLRGRVGRSKSRAYCYLLVPPNRKLDETAAERLKVIQENTSLGSGITIAQHDLELRGSGDILGQEQSGHINAIGYEMYLELLEDAIAEAKGEPLKSDAIEPDINIRIPALIPDRYIPDIRIRLSYYKALTEIDSPADLDRIEEELQDQFGPLPEPVHNLMGLMLIRKYCKDLGIKDISSSTAMVTLSFTDKATIPPNKIVELSMRENKKYAITPDQKFKIRMKNITWPNIYEELMYLKSFAR